MSRQHPRREPGEDQRRRQNDRKLIDEGAARNPLDDRQFPARVEARHVLRSDGGVVDDDSHRLGRGLRGARSDVVEGGRSCLRKGRDVIEEGDESACHGMSAPVDVGARPDKRINAGAHILFAVGGGELNTDARL